VTQQKKILTSFIKIEISILIIGVLFKIMHWPYASLLLLSSFGSIMILYVIRFLYKSPKVFLDFIKVSFVLSWAIHGILFICILPYKLPFAMIAIISFFMGIVVMINTDHLEKFDKSRVNTKTQSIYPLIGSFAAIFIAIGFLFKMFHFPGTTILILAGIVCCIAWGFISLSSKRN